MKLSSKILIAGMVIAISLSAGSSFAEGKHKLVGPKKCSLCHKGEKNNNIFEKWQSSGHSKAMATLSNAESEKIAKQKGLKTAAKDSKECLDCHATAASDDPAMMADGVTCEECHGAAGDWMALHTKKDTQAKAKEAGLIVTPTEKDCIKCHNKKSPTFKSFNFKEQWAKISHSLPKK